MGKSARSRGWGPLVAAVLAASTFAPDAWSQSAKELAHARERFKEAAALQAGGDFARALEAYKDVAQVKSTAHIRFNIATCEEKLGDYVSALGTYRLALTEATKSNSKDIESSVQAALAELEPRIPTLTLRRGEGAAVAEVTLDGRKVANPSIGVEFQVNPGPHDLRATAPDRLPFAAELTLADKDHRVVELVLKPRAVAAPLPPSPRAPWAPWRRRRAPTTSPPSDEPPHPPPDRSRPLRFAGIGVGGAGVVSLVLSGVFYGMRNSAISTLNGECGASHMTCPADAAGTRNSGQSDATISTATFIVGLGALAIGGTLVGLSLRKKAPPPTAGLVVLPGGAAVRGAF